MKRRHPTLRDARMAPVKVAAYGMGDTESPKCTAVAPGRGIRLCMKKTGPAGPVIRQARDICAFVRGAADKDRESFYTMHMDTRGRVIGFEEVSRGGLASVEAHPREVFKSAILNSAAAIAIAHNHPSGSTEASRDDRELTARLVDAGKLLGIPVRDHVIVASDGCRSLRDNGMHFEGAGFGRARRRR